MINRILLVDDDPEFRCEFKECFDDFGIAEASSGAEALAILKKPNEIDLVILDVRMSGMDGIELLNRIRQLMPNIRIVMLTGYSSKDIAVKALRGQADDFIEKPFDIDSTRKLIQKFTVCKRGEPDTDAINIDAKIERVKAFLERNVLRKVTLEDAAKIVCMSSKYLSRVFKDHTGKGFNEFKLSIKIEEAKNMLNNSGYTVNQISDKLGYGNTESFIRQFKKNLKKTPTEFRNITQKKTRPYNHVLMKSKKTRQKRS